MDNEKLAALQAKGKELEQQINELKGQGQTAEVIEALNAAQAEHATVSAQLEAATLQAKNAQLEQALLGQRTKDASEAVKKAVLRGAIPAKDEALQAKWEKKCVEDPENMELLASMKGTASMNSQPGTTINLRGVQVQRESSVAVLNAFGNERNPLKRAGIYREIVKRVYTEGDDMPLQAATVTTGTLTGTLVTQRTLELLKLQFPVLSSISTDFSDQPAHLNQAITSRIITVPTVVSYDSGGAGTGWTDQDVTFTDKSVTLNQHRGVPITFTAATLASTARRLFDEIAPAQAYALAKDMVDTLYAVITAGNFTETAITADAASFGRPDVIDMDTALTKLGVPDGANNRTLLVNANYYGNLSKDQSIVTLAAFQRPAIIEQGVLPDVSGFKVVKAANLPTTGNLAGFGFSRSALLIVARTDSDYTTVLPGASYGNAQVVTDPDLGLSVLQVQFVNHALATASQRISLIYGVAAGQSKAGQRLVSA